MPDLTLPYPVDDSPHRPEREYVVEVEDIRLFVHFEGHRAYVRVNSDDYLDVSVYCASYLDDSRGVEVLKEVRHLKREFDL